MLRSLRCDMIADINFKWAGLRNVFGKIASKDTLALSVILLWHYPISVLNAADLVVV